MYSLKSFFTLLILHTFALFVSSNVPSLQVSNCVLNEFNGLYKFNKALVKYYHTDDSSREIKFNKIFNSWSIQKNEYVYKQLNECKNTSWTLEKLDMSKYSINIAFAGDDETIDSIPVALNSIQNKNILNRINIHYIHLKTNYSTSKFYRLREYVFSFNNLKLFFYSKPTGIHTGGDNYLIKTYIPELLPSNVNKLLFFDTAVIVNIDLHELYNTDTGSTGIVMKTTHNTIKSLEKVGDCGVMVMNLDILRKNKFTEKCVKLYDKKTKQSDEFIINMYTNGKFTELNKFYNILHFHDSELLGSSKGEYIYHYADRESKPYPTWYQRSSLNVSKGIHNQYLWDSNQVSKFNFLKKPADNKLFKDSSFIEIDNILLKTNLKSSKNKAYNFGVLIYDNELGLNDNIGDFVQSLAAMNIYRIVIQKHNKVHYNNMDDFLFLVFKNEIPNFNFIFIKRDDMGDLSQYHGINNIITIMNGWWLQPYNILGEIRFTIPPNIIPIFVSFHIAEEKLFQDQYLSIFKKYEPIGCRDERTATKLKALGVKAYFSGCLTTTISFYKWSNKTSNIYFVDTVNSHYVKNAVNIQHIKKEYTNLEYPRGFIESLMLLKLYSESTKVVTSRLHCYLPCMAMGVPVKFISPSGDDNIKEWGSKDRFNGLMELNHDKRKFMSVRNNLTNNVVEKIHTLMPSFNNKK